MRHGLRPKWVEGVDAAVAGLPWSTSDWFSEQSQPMDAAAVNELVHVFHDVLPDDMAAPQIHPNWNGGAMVVWELGDLCLEIEAVPGRPVQ